MLVLGINTNTMTNIDGAFGMSTVKINDSTYLYLFFWLKWLYIVLERSDLTIFVIYCQKRKVI